jgi:eukaryotic-like serine/threonine-protein kinase
MNRTMINVRRRQGLLGQRWLPIAAMALGLFQAAAAAAAPPQPGINAWPMFRGSPGLVGVAGGKLPDSLALQWTFKTEGPVKSSAAIDAGRVFVGSDDGQLYALDLATGKKVWAFKTEGPVESSPLVLNGRVFFGSTDAFLYAVDARTGSQVWKYETGDKILSGPNWFQPAHSPNPWILVGSYDYKLHCLDWANGKTNWTYETGNYINGSPAISEGKTVFGGCDAVVHVISLEDGK